MSREVLVAIIFYVAHDVLQGSASLLPPTKASSNIVLDYVEDCAARNCTYPTNHATADVWSAWVIHMYCSQENTHIVGSGRAAGASVAEGATRTAEVPFLL
jgi:hypothetical protein